MNIFIKKINEALTSYRLPQHASILAAVSGGADSVAMLRALAEIIPPEKLAVVHVNHCIRPEAVNDADFVSKLCANLHLKFFCKQIDVPALANKQGISLEMAARNARYRFFSDTASKFSAVAVTTAHTLDDQAETILLKLTRGAGSAGLDGIEPSTDFAGLRVLRPMLKITRQEVEIFLKKIDQPWIEDASNADTNIPRNLIRHCILPQLKEKLNPRISSALARTATIMRDENNLLNQLATDAFQSTLSDNAIAISSIRNCHPAIRRRIIQLWLVSAGIHAYQMRFDTIERIIKMALNKNGNGSITVSDNISICREYQQLKLMKTTDRDSLQPIPDTIIKVPGSTIIKTHNIIIHTTIRSGFERNQPGRIGQLPAEATLRWNDSPKLMLRSWMPGDSMHPIGLSGHRKLQDIFSDAKVTKNNRQNIPVFVCNNKIAWIPGYRIAQCRAVDNAQQKSLEIKVTRITDEI